MIKLTIGATLVAAALFSNAALAEHANIKPKAHDSLGKCVKAALAKHDGTIVKVEFKNEGKSGVYE
ncbi:MAG TPA: peptidase, partial [Methylotenera sp.]|nr:peptidase [Methylotenera sp.]